MNDFQIIALVILGAYFFLIIAGYLILERKGSNKNNRSNW